jgi:hypothetical protein
MSGESAPYGADPTGFYDVWSIWLQRGDKVSVVPEKTSKLHLLNHSIT